MIAERPIVSSLLVVALAAGIGTLAARRSSTQAPSKPTPKGVVSIVLIDGDCPARTYHAIHLRQGDAVLHCRRDQRGVFVVARYFTTEPWERVALVDDSGRLIGRMEDRPYRNGDSLRFDYFSE